MFLLEADEGKFQERDGWQAYDFRFSETNSFDDSVCLRLVRSI